MHLLPLIGPNIFPIYSHPDSLPTPGIYLSVASSAETPCKCLIIIQSNCHLLQHYGYADLLPTFSPLYSTESSQMEKFIAEYAIHREKIHHALRLQISFGLPRFTNMSIGEYNIAYVIPPDIEKQRLGHEIVMKTYLQSEHSQELVQ